MATSRIESVPAFPLGIKVSEINNGIIVYVEKIAEDSIQATFFADEKTCIAQLDQMWAEHRAGLLKRLNDHAMRVRK